MLSTTTLFSNVLKTGKLHYRIIKRQYYVENCKTYKQLTDILNNTNVVIKNKNKIEESILHSNAITIKNIKDIKCKIPKCITPNLVLIDCSVNFLNNQIDKSHFPQVENIFVLGYVDTNFLNYWLKYKNVNLYLPHMVNFNILHLNLGNFITYDRKVYKLIETKF